LQSCFNFLKIKEHLWKLLVVCEAITIYQFNIYQHFSLYPVINFSRIIPLYSSSTAR